MYINLLEWYLYSVLVEFVVGLCTVHVEIAEVVTDFRTNRDPGERRPVRSDRQSEVIGGFVLKGIIVPAVNDRAVGIVRGLYAYFVCFNKIGLRYENAGCAFIYRSRI